MGLFSRRWFSREYHCATVSECRARWTEPFPAVSNRCPLLLPLLLLLLPLLLLHHWCPRQPQRPRHWPPARASAQTQEHAKSAFFHNVVSLFNAGLPEDIWILLSTSQNHQILYTQRSHLSCLLQISIQYVVCALFDFGSSHPIKSRFLFLVALFLFLTDPEEAVGKYKRSFQLVSRS